MSASVADALKRAGAEDLSRRWLRILIAGRGGAAMLLLGAAALWPATLAGGGAESSRLSGTTPVALIALGLSAAYALLLRFSRLTTAAQAATQFAFDLLLVTWLVWATGSFYSPYSALYIVVISVAGLFLGARAALLAAVGCAVAYTAAMFGLMLGLTAGRGQPRVSSIA